MCGREEECADRDGERGVDERVCLRKMLQCADTLTPAENVGV